MAEQKVEADCPFRERPVIKYLYRVRPYFTSCPTCGRCQVTETFYEIAQRVQDTIENLNSPVHVAVMGCAVNGPGEAKDADIGVACGRGNAVLFEKGEKVKSIPVDQIIQELLERIPFIHVEDKHRPEMAYLCWAGMEAECTFLDSLKPCHNSKAREDYVKQCQYRGNLKSW